MHGASGGEGSGQHAGKASGQAAVAVAALVVAVCAVVFGAAPRGGLPAYSVLEGVDISALEAQAATGLPSSGRARTQDLADAGAFETGVRSGSSRKVVYGNDGSGDEVELEPVIGARTQSLYDTAGINAGAGGLITPMQRATVCVI